MKNASRLCGGVVLLLATLLAGCAAPPPLFQQLKADKVERITLVVEQDPFSYQPANSPEQAAPVAAALFGAIGSTIAQGRQSHENGVLVAAARTRGIANDHRVRFWEEVDRRFRQRGVQVTQVRVPFSAPPLADRSFSAPSRSDLLQLPKDAPAFWLRADFGNCTIGNVVPCVRYTFEPVATAGGTGPRYRRVTGIVRPAPDDRSPPTIHFADTDTAVARLPEFDAAFGPLIPIAAERLVQDLEAEQRR